MTAMPPKKSKTQANASSSQPAPALERPTRTTASRKRRHSDASNASDRLSSSHSVAAATPSKRPKRGKAAAQPEAEMIVEEEAEVTEPAQPSLGSAPACDAVAGAESFPVTKHVHFGSTALVDFDEDEEDMDKTTATHITPHPSSKMAVKRRTTASPILRADAGAGAETSKRVKRTSTRHSLPAALAENGEELVYYVAEHDYAPLSEVLQARMQRRMQQHAERRERIRALELELDEDQQRGNRHRVKEVKAQLLALREEQNTAMDTQISQDVEALDQDMLVLERQEEIAYPDLSNGLNVSSSGQTTGGELVLRTSTSLRESRSSVTQELDSKWQMERERFADALLALSKEATEAKTQLKVLEIELQGLGLAEGGLDAKDVLISIRESFSRVRESLTAVLPNSVSDNASNHDLISALVTNIAEFSNRLRLTDRELYDKDIVVADLSKQVQGLLDHLAEAEIRKQTLQERWNDLDQANETKDRENEDLQEEIEATVQERDAIQAALGIETERVKSLTQENLEFASNMHRLSSSLLKYQEDEKRLHETITKMEEEHATDVAQMNREREEIIRESDGRLHEQITLREMAHQLAGERQSIIISLQSRIEQVEAERDATREDLEHMTSLRNEESGAREIAEVDLKEKSDEVDELESRVDRLEDELSELNTELDNLRRSSENERTQREAAEADLDGRNAQVEELSQKVRELGKQANELRLKLFEIQQENERKVQELEQIAFEREEQYQVDIAQEVERRERADELGQQRGDKVEALQTQLQEIEEQMRTLLVQRDDRIEALELELTYKNEDVETLRLDLKSVEDLYEEHVEQSKQRREELEGSISALQSTVTAHETTLNQLRQEDADAVNLHAAEIDDRDVRIAELEHRFAAEKIANNDLRTEKLSLEMRVTKEASEMLTLQAQKDEEIDSLKSIIRDKQAKILVVEEKAIESDEQWQELLKQRDEDIRMMTTESESTTQTVIGLKAEIESMDLKFHEYARRTSSKIEKLRRIIGEANTAINEDGDTIKADGEELLGHFNASVSFAASQAAITTTTTTTTQAGRQSHALPSSSKKKVKDSGIGIEEDELLAA